MHIPLRADATPAIQSTAAATALLDGRAFHRAVGTVHTAVAGPGFQECVAGLAFVVVLAGVRGHSFALLVAAVRTGEGGFEDQVTHAIVLSAGVCIGMRRLCHIVFYPGFGLIPGTEFVSYPNFLCNILQPVGEIMAGGCRRERPVFLAVEFNGFLDDLA